jgi:hypothetical protein
MLVSHVTIIILKHIMEKKKKLHIEMLLGVTDLEN